MLREFGQQDGQQEGAQRWAGSRQVFWHLGWFEVEWGVVCEWDVPVSMLGKSLKVAVCLCMI